VKSARRMTDEAIAAELVKLDREFTAMRTDPEFEGHGGSPGEWMVERMDELETEKARRLISLDGDIGRKNPRV
jgi:hypothetical protein